MNIDSNINMMRRIRSDEAKDSAAADDDDSPKIAAEPAAALALASIAAPADERDTQDDSPKKPLSKVGSPSNKKRARSSDANEEDSESMSTAKLPFPWKLHTLLDDAEEKNFSEIVSWEPDGKAFRVHKPQDFCETVMGQYFRQSKFESFTRQLYIYGFSKVEKKGPSQGAFSHPYFLRDNKPLSLSLGRNQVGDRRRKRPSVTSNSSSGLGSSGSLQQQLDDEIAAGLLQGQSVFDSSPNTSFQANQLLMRQQQELQLPLSTNLSIQQQQQPQLHPFGRSAQSQQQHLSNLSLASLRQQHQPDSWDAMVGGGERSANIMLRQQQQRAHANNLFLQEQVRRSSLSQQLSLTSPLQLANETNVSPIRSSRLLGLPVGSALLEAEARLSLTGSPSRTHSLLDITANESKKDALDSSHHSAPSGQGMVKWGGAASAAANAAQRSGQGMVQWPDLEPRPIEEMMARPLQKGQESGSQAASNANSDNDDEKIDTVRS